MTMKTFQIVANGVNMGAYRGDSEQEALDAYAQDAGYRDYADVLSVTGDDARAVEWDRPAYCVQKSVQHCRECSLTNYGRDCQNNKVTA